MKKHFLFLIVLLAFSVMANAQLVKSQTLTKNSQKKHEVWMDFGAGVSCSRLAGDSPQNAFRASVGIRWTKCYGQYFAMDYINFSASYSPDKSKKDGGGASLLIGPKAKLPISEKATLFANANFGAAYLTFAILDHRYNGVSYCQETGLGIIFNERVSLSAAYIYCPKVGDYKYKVINDSFVGKFSFSF